MTVANSPRRVPLWALKLMMSITGLIGLGFVLVHLLGNLKVYGGAAGFDTYAHWLRAVGYPLIPHQGVLWALRVVLVVCLVVHVATALALSTRARRARGPVRPSGEGSACGRGAPCCPPAS